MVALEPSGQLLGSWSSAPMDAAPGLEQLPELQPAECLLRLRKMLAEPPLREWVPILDSLLGEACMGIRELEGDSSAEAPTTSWVRHVRQLTLQYQEVCEQARDWRRCALLPSGTPFSGFTNEVGGRAQQNEVPMVAWPLVADDRVSQCQREVDELRRHVLADHSSEIDHRWSHERDVAAEHRRDELIFSMEEPSTRQGLSEDTAARLSFAEQACMQRAAAGAIDSGFSECRKSSQRRKRSNTAPKSRPVDLAMYDLSKGLASWMPAMLLSGKKWEAIWHTGVRVFGFEFTYGGDIVQAAPEVLPFGVPLKILRLGTTQRRYKELREFIRHTLANKYSKDGYDALQCNCNHFSNDLVQFLLQGQQIPEEVRAQLDWYRNAALVQVLRPVLTRWLGAAETGGHVWSAADELQTPATSMSLQRSASFLGCCQYVTCPSSKVEEGCVGSPWRPDARGTVQTRTRARCVSRERGGGEDLDVDGVAARTRCTSFQSL